MNQPVTKAAAIEAIRTLRNFCGQQKCCGDCQLFEACVRGDVPCDWTIPDENKKEEPK